MRLTRQVSALARRRVPSSTLTAWPGEIVEVVKIDGVLVPLRGREF